jgi:hypothetical protein
MPSKRTAKKAASASKATAKAIWTVANVRPATTADGVVSVSADLRDSGKVQGTFTLTITADRAMRCEWVGAPGAVPMTDFQAWMKEA